MDFFNLIQLHVCYHVRKTEVNSSLSYIKISHGLKV